MAALEADEAATAEVEAEAEVAVAASEVAGEAAVVAEAAAEAAAEEAWAEVPRSSLSRTRNSLAFTWCEVRRTHWRQRT